MTDIAMLGLAVNSDTVIKATRDLELLERIANATERTADGLEKGFARTTQSVSRLSGAMKVLAPLFATIASAVGAQRLVAYTAVWTDLNSRVNIAAGSMVNGAAVMKRLGEMADRTYTSLEQTAETYLLNATALRELGYSTQQALDYTEALNNALVISGAKGDRAAAVVNAFSKAMSLGKLSGDELRTVTTMGGRAAEVLAESLGVSTYELAKLGKQGKLTGDVIQKAFAGAFQTLQRESEEMPATISDAFIRINNAVLRYIGVMDQAGGASAAFAGAMITVAENIGRVVTYAIAAGGVWAGAYVIGVAAAATATNGLTLAMTLLRGALIRTGLGALIVLAGELVYQFLELVRETGSVGNAFKALYSIGKQSFERMGDIVRGFGFLLSSAALRAKADFLDAFAAIAQGAARLTGSDSIAGYGRDMQASALKTRELAESDTRQFRNFMSVATRPFEYDKVKDPAADLTGRGPKPPPASDEKADKAARRMAENYAEITRGAQQFIAAQELEARVMGMTEEAANALRYTQDLLNQAANDNIKLTPQMTAELQSLGAEMAAAEGKTSRLKAAYDFAKGTFQGFFQDIRSGIADGKGIWNSLADAALNALNRISEKLVDMATDQLFSGLFGNLAGGGSSGGSGLFAGIAKMLGFAEGGFTGAGSKYQPAGIVHAGEYVFSQQATNRIGVGALDRMHENAKGYSAGGFVIPRRGYADGGYVRSANDNGGTVVQIVDQRAAGSPAIEQERSTGPNGEQMLRLLIRDEQAKNIANGRMDSPQRARFGNQPRRS